MIVGFEDELHRFGEVGFDFVAGAVEFARLGGDSFGKGHEVADALVAIVFVEVAKVGEGTTVGKVDGSEDFGEPLAVGGVSAVILDEDVDVVFGGKGGEFVEAIGDLFGRFFWSALAIGVDPNGMASESFRGGDPALVFVDGLVALFLGGRSDAAFAIDHDEDIGHPEVVDAGVEVGEVGFVFRLVFEELIDVLQRVNAVIVFGVLGQSRLLNLPALSMRWLDHCASEISKRGFSFFWAERAGVKAAAELVARKWRLFIGYGDSLDEKEGGSLSPF